jgi:hypothetical protein
MKILNNHAVWSLAVIASLLMAASCSDNSNASQLTTDPTSKYVGVYFLEDENFEDETLTLNADGTETTVFGSMFSEVERAGSRSTTAKGVWRETGENEILVSNLRFWTDSLGNELAPDGTTMKATFTLTFDDPVNETSPVFVVSNILVELFQPNQNPVTDEPFAVFTLDGGGRGYRLEAGY